MTTRSIGSTGASPLTYARVAGLLYIVIIVFAGFSEIVRSNLVVPGDAPATADNILASEGLFRIGFTADLVAFLADVIVAALFYVLLEPVSRTLSLVAAFLRLVGTAIYGINTLNQFTALLLLDPLVAADPTELDTGRLDALVLVSLDAHNYGYLIGLVFFGFHLLVLGYLLYQSGYFPRILGILVVVGSLGYLLDSFMNFLLPSYAGITNLIVTVTAVAAELALAFYLLVRGINVQRYNRRVQ